MSFVSIFTCCSYAADKYIWSSNSESVATSNTEDVAQPVDSSSNPLNLQSGAAILIDQDSGQILYEHNIHEKLRPASVTKIMSILLIMEALDEGRITLDTQIPCSENASSMGGSQVYLNTGEKLPSLS